MFKISTAIVFRIEGGRLAEHGEVLQTRRRSRMPVAAYPCSIRTKEAVVHRRARPRWKRKQRTFSGATELPPAPTVGAPVLDPTDKRDVETELRRGYSGTARRKGRQQTNRAYCHRATSRLYRPRPLRRRDSTADPHAIAVVGALTVGDAPLSCRSEPSGGRRWTAMNGPSCCRP